MGDSEQLVLSQHPAVEFRRDQLSEQAVTRVVPGRFDSFAQIGPYVLSVADRISAAAS